LRSATIAAFDGSVGTNKEHPMRRTLLLTLIVASLSASSAFAQTSADGAIRGYVRDEQGGALPGVTVVATSTTVTVSPQAVTDADGFYRLSLAPAEYTLTAELPGFARFVRSGIVVRTGLNIAVDLTMKVGGLEETIEVRGDTPMIEVDRPVQSINIDGEFQRALPLSPRRDYTDFLEVTPGLNTYVNPQSGGGIYSLRGSTIESHVVQVDGADMNSFRQARPDYIAISSDSLEDVQVKTAASDASAPLGVGVVINVATPSGTNQLKGSASAAYANKDWSSDNNPTGQANYASVAQMDLSIGGRVLRDRSWFFGTLRKVTRDIGINRTQGQLDLHSRLNPGWEAFDNTFQGTSVFVKSTTQLGSANRFETFYQWDDYPTTSNQAVDSANVQVQAYGGRGYSSRLSSVWGSSTTTRMSVSYNNKALNSSADDYDGYIGNGPSRPVHSGTFLSAGVLTGTGELIRLNNIESGFLSPGSKWTIAADLTYFRRGWLGSHELQTGVNLQPWMAGTNTTIYSNGGFALEDVVMRDPANQDAGLIPFHRRVYDAAEVLTADVSATDNAAYLQDTWRPTTRLTISGGIRFDSITARDRLVDLKTQNSLEIGPRFGATYALSADKTDVVRASWGRIHELVQAGRVPTASSASVRRVDVYDNNLDGIFETERVTPGSTITRRDRVLDPDVHQPYIDEWTAGYRRQFPGQLSIDAAFVRREYRDRPALVETNGIYDGNVFKGYRDEELNDIFLVTNSIWNWYVYSGFELAVAKRTSRVQLISSYVRAWRHIEGTWQPNDPASFIQPEAFPNDKGLGIPRTAPSNSLSGTADTFGNTGWQDHTGRIAVVLSAPWGMQLSTSYTIQSGPYTGPVVTRIAAPDPQFGPPSVTLSNGRVVSNPLATTIRFAFPTRGEGQVKANARQELNLKIGRIFKFGTQRIEADVDFFNLTNEGSIERYRTDANQLYNPFYLGGESIQPPRSVHFAVRYVF
jgi:hypothetical protein